MKHLMAIDAGTTGIRAIIFDEDSQMVSHAYETIELHQPRPGWSEQDPNGVWQACQQVMKQALTESRLEAQDIETIGVATLRSTNLLWRSDGRPLYNAITWHDTRTADLCREMDNQGKIRAARGLGHVARALSSIWPALRRGQTAGRLITASHLSFTPASALAHTAWLLDNVEDARSLASRDELRCGTMDTWLLWNLTGGTVHATDTSNASATGMYDPYSLSWSSLFLDAFDIPEGILPEVQDTAGLYGYLDERILGREIPITGVVADQQGALFGETCFEPGEVKCTNGTGTFIDMNVGDRPAASLHRLVPMIAWSINGRVTYMLEGMINTTGAAVQWLRDNLGVIDHVDQSCQMAQCIEDAGDIYFVPAFTGLSSPYWDPHACGIVVGLHRTTTKEHIVRAVLEGIVYRCRDIMLSMERDAGLPVRSITADGGASKNDFLLQFMADMLDVHVERPRMLDGTALGAAYLAGLAADVWESKEELRKRRQVEQTFKPAMPSEKRERLYAGWRRAVEKSFRWRHSA
ncbi:MAG: glycerol kinase 5 [Thermoplasmatota archaeon]